MFALACIGETAHHSFLVFYVFPNKVFLPEVILCVTFSLGRVTQPSQRDSRSEVGKIQPLHPIPLQGHCRTILQRPVSIDFKRGNRGVVHGKRCTSAISHLQFILLSSPRPPAKLQHMFEIENSSLFSVLRVLW